MDYKSVFEGFEWVDSYGSLSLDLPLASIQVYQETGRQSDPSPRPWVVKINQQPVKWADGVKPPFTAGDATRRALAVVRSRAEKLLKALNTGKVTP